MSELIWEELSSFGLSERDAVNVLIEALEHPVKGPELLYQLKLDDPSVLLRGFSLCCGHERCEELATPHAKLGLLQVSDAQCVVCAGSESQRWYRFLMHVAREQGKTKLLLIGGEDANTSTLRQLSRACPGLSWSFVSGDERCDQTTANRRVEGASLVLLWGGMNLPHKLSDLYKNSTGTLNIPCATIPPGQRGVIAICQTALISLGVSPEELER